MLGCVELISFLINSARIISKQGIKNIRLKIIHPIFLRKLLWLILLQVLSFNEILKIKATIDNPVIMRDVKIIKKRIFVEFLNKLKINKSKHPIKTANNPTKNMKLEI